MNIIFFNKNFGGIKIISIFATQNKNTLQKYNKFLIKQNNYELHNNNNQPQLPY